MSKEKDLEYYKRNCEEDYKTTPISVLRYITELEYAQSKPETVEAKSSTLTKDEVKGWIGSKDVEAKEEKKEFYCANRNQKLNTDLCNVSQCEKCKSIQRLGSKN
jgi:hypothetical protein